MKEKMFYFFIYLYTCVLVTTTSAVESNDTSSEDNSNENNTVICLSNKLVVKGNTIRMSEILNITCLSTAKYIQLFALESVIIDKNFTKSGQVQLAIIAPKWEIYNQTKIVLDGNSLFPLHSIKDQAASGIGRYKDGKPGKPGESSGSFLGIGKEFVNAENLQIHLNGGDGWPGQHGGNGMSVFSHLFRIGI